MTDRNDEKLVALINRLPSNILNAFRDRTFTVDFIQKFPAIFLTHDWINLDALQNFLCTNGHEKFLEENIAQIKHEPVEQGIDSLVPATAVPRTRLLHENQRVYIEILDSDEENDSDADAQHTHFLDAGIPALPQAEPRTPLSSQDGSYDLDPDYCEDPGDNDINPSPSSSPVALSRLGSIGVGNSAEELESDFEINSIDDDYSSDSEAESVTSDMVMDVEWKDAETQWMEDHISSEVLEKRSPVNRLLNVQQVEKIYGGIPSNWPIHREPTAYLVDLSDPQYLRDGKVIDPEILLSEERREIFSWSPASYTVRRNDMPFGENCNIKAVPEFNFTDLMLTVDTIELEACRTFSKLRPDHPQPQNPRSNFITKLPGLRKQSFNTVSKRLFPGKGVLVKQNSVYYYPGCLISLDEHTLTWTIQMWRGIENELANKILHDVPVSNIVDGLWKDDKGC
ncbi:hypothetical protein BT96DRAFT_950053 [Gymnopus androsaceus JB14]|uniref:Uncharacterized protein n=1 Tax=Gymnopus androsaceus JB14 TaxID=1447944 RepID=A0A6A4GHM2_9AGAR|nr:hypothetical protein BT96DRAFT_950053 [Gymnopus androsaceus JB14]